MNTVQRLHLNLMADYDCQPIWIDVTPYNIDPADFPISPGLQDALYAWQKRCDDTLDREKGRNSGFRTPKATAAFNAEGTVLLDRLQTELGSHFQVTFHPW